jgi:hypothetical protein
VNLQAFARALLVIVVVAGAAGAILLYSVARRGLSNRTEPSEVEELLARTTRRLATPTAVRSMHNPFEATKPVLDEALEHFADH